ncbi:SCF ubiquitin ligase complex subunit [Basidiobolus ranarum]|uniref:SCF ubiquitin ligase complex subunit n=1 Tax=Basidiobolus ranarum TaxID=34480 RepID=A0ABR2WM66_9FUNG
MALILPPEVLQHIIGYLSEPKDLLSCCLVCSTWCKTGQSHLWNAPVLSRIISTKDHNTFESFFQTTKNSVSLLIQKIETSYCPFENLDKILSWILRLQSLRVLKLPVGYLTCSRISNESFAFQNLRLLEHLSIEQTDAGTRLLYQLIAKCPLLEDISIQLEASHVSNSTLLDVSPKYIPVAKRLQRLKIMEEFRLKPGGRLKSEFLEAVILATPCVQRFTIVSYTIPNGFATILNERCPNLTHFKMQNIHVYGGPSLNRKLSETCEAIALHFSTQMIEMELDFRRAHSNNSVVMLPNTWYEHSWTYLTSLKLSGIQINQQQMIALSQSLTGDMEVLEINLPTTETHPLQFSRNELNLHAWLSLFTKCGGTLTSVTVGADYLPNRFVEILSKHCNKLKHLKLESHTVDDYSVYDIVRYLGKSLNSLHIQSVNLGTKTFHLVARKCVKLEQLNLSRTIDIPSHQPYYYSDESRVQPYMETSVTSQFLQSLTRLSLVNWRLGVEFFQILSNLKNSKLSQVRVSEPVDNCFPLATLRSKFPEFNIVE